MKDANSERHLEDSPRGMRRNRGSQSASGQPGSHGARNSPDLSLLFPLIPHDLPGAGQFERCWWVSAPHWRSGIQAGQS